MNRKKSNTERNNNIIEQSMLKIDLMKHFVHYQQDNSNQKSSSQLNTVCNMVLLCKGCMERKKSQTLRFYPQYL